MVLSAVRKSDTVVTNLVQHHFQVVFKAATGQLDVLGEDGALVRAIPIDQPAVLTFNIQASDLKFNESPIEWVLGSFDHQLSFDRKTLILLVGPPASVIQPLVFNLVANLTSPHVPGIRTSNMFISRTGLLTSSIPEILGYNHFNGTFNFNSGWPLQPGQLLVFLRHKDDHPEPVTVHISLTSQDSQAQIRFADHPMKWLTSDNTPPHWIQIHRQEDGASLHLVNHFFAGIGLAAPFRFVIEVDGVLVESPDPILVNTTIGDG